MHQFGVPSAPLKVISYAGLHEGTLTWSQASVKAILPQSHKLDADARHGTLGRPEDGPCKWPGLQQTGGYIPSLKLLFGPCRCDCNPDPMMTSLPFFKSHWKSEFSCEIA